MLDKLLEIYNAVNDYETKKLVRQVAAMIFDDMFSDIREPNDNEIRLAETQGRVAAVKALRERSGMGLADSARAMDAKMKSLNKQYYRSN